MTVEDDYKEMLSTFELVLASGQEWVLRDLSYRGEQNLFELALEALKRAHALHHL